MEAGNFWNLSKTNTRETNFFATRDTNKVPLNDISFATNIENKPPEETKELKTGESKPKINVSNVETDENSDTNNEEQVKDEEYCLQLVSLNKCVLDWINLHIKKNPCIDLTPVIRDYEKHLRDIGKKYKLRNEASATQVKKFVYKTPEQTHPSPVASTSGGKADSVTFISSTPIQNNTGLAVPKFPPVGFFSLPPAPAKPATVDKPEATNENAGSENAVDEDAPPVVERKVIVEDDAFHQIRCKLFFKKGAQWQELGIGMAYLKPCGKKIQLLIRMEAVTGKVLLNINVSDELPVSRSGKNNVMVVSIPNPPVYSKPTDGDNSLPCTYLIRVKGTAEADELLSKLKSNS